MEPIILYEDEDVLTINKPAGLVVHSDGKTEESNLVDWLSEKYPGIKDVGEPIKVQSKKYKVKSNTYTETEIDQLIIPRPGIVHRLDRETSGVMLVAKNQKSFENLKNQFQENKIKKVYEAFVWGVVKEDGVVSRPIGRSASDFRKWSAQRGARGEMREAETEYKVLAKNKDYSLLEIFPKTGRTHQIRVHMKAINHPLVGDSLYGPKKENQLGFSRTALHSKKITFTDLKGESHTIEAPFPEDFLMAKNSLQK
jgi:23S rRNA pseudouridine1911/1915/1917 synthase